MPAGLYGFEPFTISWLWLCLRSLTVLGSGTVSHGYFRLSGSITLNVGSKSGVKSKSSSFGFITAFVKAFRIVDPSANWSSVVRKEKSLVAKAILMCGIIRRAEVDLG